MNANSLSAKIGVNLPTAAPAAPTLLTATLQAGPQVSLQWRDNATNESGFVVERATAVGGPFVQVGIAPARNNTGNTTFTDTTIATGQPYWYRVAAVNLFGGVSPSTYSDPATTDASPAVPAAPSNLAAANGANQGNKRSVNPHLDGQLGQRDRVHDPAGHERGVHDRCRHNHAAAGTTPANDHVTGLSKATTYYFRIRANNAVGSSAWVNATPSPSSPTHSSQTPLPGAGPPPAPGIHLPPTCHHACMRCDHSDHVERVALPTAP